MNIAASRRIHPARYLYWPAAVASAALVLIGAGPAAAVPMLCVIALAGLLSTRMQTSAMVLLAVSLIVDNPDERPADGQWQSLLYQAGRFLYENIRKYAGIEALRFSALELVIFLLICIIFLRKATHDPIDDPLHLSAIPNPIKMAFGLFCATIVFLEVYGLARGGDFKNSLWQLRQLFWLPLLGVLFGNAFKSEAARAAVLRTLLAAAWIRCLVGIYFKFAIVRPQGLDVAYVTTHSDSILTVVAMLIAVALLVERPTLSHWILNALLQPVYLVGLGVNNRRIAFVALAGGLLTLVLLGPPVLRKMLQRFVAIAVPLVIVYAAVGWNSKSVLFQPVSTLKAVSTSEDSSSQTRDIENYNLVQTLKRNPAIGSGFGHEYYEAVRANRVDQIFAQYLYIAHNSTLWLLSISGWVGFTFLWMVFPVSILIALRVHRRGATTADRVTALASIVASLSFLIQAWGDMGFQSWMGTIVFTSLTGACGAMFTAQHCEEKTK